MSVINEVCGTSTSPKNLGGKDQCLEKAVKTLMLAKDSFSFADLATFKTEAAWETAIENKDIVPLPNVENPEENNTEAVIKNGAHRDYTIKDAIPGSNYRIDASICTYEALKSYENTEYTRVFEITFDDEVTADVQSDGTIKGRKITSLTIPLRARATAEDVPFTGVNVKFSSDLFSILKTDFEPSDLEGIFDVVLEIEGTPTASSIKFKALSDCSGRVIKTLEDGDVVLNDASGSAQTITFVAPDADGVYEITGTAFANDFVLGLDGVVVKSEAMYEAPVPTVISGI